MGNCCSSSANEETSDNFTGPGRRLGGGGASSTAAAAASTTNRTSQPIQSTVQSSSPGRTLGSSNEHPDDARSQAARAAQARLDQKKAGGGKLATQLRAEQGMTVNDTLNEVSRQNRDQRRADENTTAQAWN